jgi:hypothetical protein
MSSSIAPAASVAVPSTVSASSTEASGAVSLLDGPVPIVSPAEMAALTFDGRGAYERRAALIAAVDEADMLPLNRDSVQMVMIALRAWPTIASYRGKLEETYKTYDFAAFDALPDFANATQYLNERLALARVSTDELGAAFTRAGELRDLILGDVPNLIRRRKLPETIRSEMRGPFGYANVAYDLGRLSGYYLESWEQVQENSGMTKAEIAEAEALSGRLRFLVANREQVDAAQAERSLRRQQAFTLLARTYETVRKSLVYPLHLEGKRDIEAVAPSIYAVKRGRKSVAEEETAPADPKARGGEGNGEGNGKGSGSGEGSDATPPAPVKPMQATAGVPSNIGEPFNG